MTTHTAHRYLACWVDWRKPVMNKLCAAALIAWVLLPVSLAGAAEPQDGNWWNAQPRALQVYWAIGFLDGVTVGYDSSRSLMAIVGNPVTSALPPNCDASCLADLFKLHSYLENIIRVREQEYDGISAGEIADGLNHIYSDYRNRRINILDAAVVVVYSIKGASEEQMQRRLEYLRKSTPPD